MTDGCYNFHFASLSSGYVRLTPPPPLAYRLHRVFRKRATGISSSYNNNNNNNNMWYLYSALIQLEVDLRRITTIFTILLSLTQTCFHPAHISTPKGAYNACCHYKRKVLLVLILFYGWVNQSPHDNIAAHGASNQRQFGSIWNCLQRKGRLT